jgi:aflatoxin B1 aldehyde reductase
MAQSAPSMVFGSAGIATFATETVKEMLNILEKHNVKQIDTASIYVRIETPKDFNGAI